MTCDEIIKSNDTYDVMIPSEYLERSILEPDCAQTVSDAYEIYYYNRQRVAPLSIENYTYSAIPKCFGLLDTSALEESGILKLQIHAVLTVILNSTVILWLTKDTLYLLGVMQLSREVLILKCFLNNYKSSAINL